MKAIIECENCKFRMKEELPLTLEDKMCSNCNEWNTIQIIDFMENDCMKKESKPLKRERKAICSLCKYVMPIKTESELRWIRYAIGQECPRCHATSLYLEGDKHLEEKL